MTRLQECVVDLSRPAARHEAGRHADALRELRDRGIMAALDAQPAPPELSQAALLVANLYRDLARYTPAEQFYLQALAGLAASAGKSHPDYARALTELGAL